MIELGAPLAKGGWCQILAITGKPALCAKVLIAKRKFKGEKPAPDHIVQHKYGISDFLDYELNNYQKIMACCPDHLRQHFVTLHGIEFDATNQKVLVMELIRDERGEIAPSLARNTRQLTNRFWATVEQIRKEVFLRHSIDHFGIVRRNILVRTPDDPVFIDFQTGRERYPWQFWLRQPWFVRQKINRCFSKLYKEMGIKMP